MSVVKAKMETKFESEHERSRDFAKLALKRGHCIALAAISRERSGCQPGEALFTLPVSVSTRTLELTSIRYFSVNPYSFGLTSTNGAAVLLGRPGTNAYR